MKREKNFERFLNLYYAVAVGLVIVMLLALGIIEKVSVYSARNTLYYKEIKEYSCREIEDEEAPIGIRKEYTWTLEDIPSGDTCLAFYLVHQYAQVTLDGELMYSLMPQEGFHFGKTIGSNWAVIPLYSEDAGAEVKVTITPVYKQFQNREVSFLTGSRMYIFLDRFEKDMPQLIISLIAILAGVIFLCISFYHFIHKKKCRELAELGEIAVIIGFWRGTDTRFTPFLFPKHPQLLLYISLTMLMIGMVPLIRVIKRRYADRQYFTFDTCCFMASTACLVLTILQLFDIVDIRESLSVTHAVIIICALAMIFTEIYDFIRRRKSPDCIVSKNSFFIFFIGGVIADVVAFYLKGNSSGLLFSLGAFLIYIISTGMLTISEYFEAETRLKEQEAELAASRISIMLSQIQPHFLYNSLNSIYYLCAVDPKKAQKAIRDFASYLRGNLDALEKKSTIPFEKELEHVQIYLSLEKMRFGDELNIVYDINETEFMIPALTVQPLVENAVKYGVGKTPDGGCVTIRTRQTESCYEVIVEDDGVGFDINEKKNDGKTHIGIENVRKRLWDMSHATLEVTGEKGHGTIAVIRLPKENEQ